jgi:hypothetical protein
MVNLSLQTEFVDLKLRTSDNVEQKERLNVSLSLEGKLDKIALGTIGDRFLTQLGLSQMKVFDRPNDVHKIEHCLEDALEIAGDLQLPKKELKALFLKWVEKYPSDKIDEELEGMVSRHETPEEPDEELDDPEEPEPFEEDEDEN